MADAGKKIRVTVRVPRSFCNYYPIPAPVLRLEAEEGVTVADLIRRAGLPEFEFGVIGVNGQRELLDYRLKDGEEIELHPILAGGL